MSLPINIQEWFFSRTVTEKVLEDFNISWNNNKIVFPVYSPEGKYLFAKYRRNPFSEEGSKYTYERGASCQLYAADKIKNKKTIIISEGENDCLTLWSHDLPAVSGTGGAGTFKDEWSDLLAGKEMFICLDNDDAGMKGAVKLLTKLPARLVLIPKEEGIKDTTDYFKKHSREEFIKLLDKAEFYPQLFKPKKEFKFIKEIKEQIKKYNQFLESLLIQERNSNQDFPHFEYIRKEIISRINDLKRKINKIRYSKASSNTNITNEDILRAKEIPIESIYKGELRGNGNNRAVGKCPFHNEKTPSFVVYLDKNKWWCFGSCGNGGDVIDFIKLRDDCDFITAVKILLNK